MGIKLTENEKNLKNYPFFVENMNVLPIDKDSNV
jgi:hypothetical protein